MKPWLVAHRGASYEEKENTLKAFITAKKYAVAMIEFDVRVSSDNVAVIHHDPNIGGKMIADATYQTLKNLDSELAIFEDVVTAADGLPLMVELKSVGAAAHVAPYLMAHPKSQATSFIVDELLELIRLGIDNKRLALAQHPHPIGLQKKAAANSFGGITVNKWYITPLFYWRARKKGLRIMAYTVNNIALAWMLRKLYPRLFLCTDKPHKLQKLA